MPRLQTQFQRFTSCTVLVQFGRDGALVCPPCSSQSQIGFAVPALPCGLVALCCACPACVVLPRRSEGVIIWSLKLVTQAAQARFMTRHTLNAFAIHSSMHTIQAWNCTALHGMGCVLCVVEMWLCAG